jgi:hypothetical protein
MCGMYGRGRIGEIRYIVGAINLCVHICISYPWVCGFVNVRTDESTSLYIYAFVISIFRICIPVCDTDRNVHPRAKLSIKPFLFRFVSFRFVLFLFDGACVLG